MSTCRPHKGCVDLGDKAPGPSVGQCLASGTERNALSVPLIVKDKYLTAIVLHYLILALLLRMAGLVSGNNLPLIPFHMRT